MRWLPKGHNGSDGLSANSRSQCEKVTCGHPECNARLVIRSDKGGQYCYYVCNRKTTAGADACCSKSIREDALDAIVLNGLLHRVLAPDAYANFSPRCSTAPMTPGSDAR